MDLEVFERVGLLDEELQQNCVEVKNPHEQLGVAALVHSDVAPFEDNVKNFTNLIRLGLYETVKSINAFDVLAKVLGLSPHLVMELCSEAIHALGL